MNKDEQCLVLHNTRDEISTLRGYFRSFARPKENNPNDHISYVDLGLEKVTNSKSCTTNYRLKLMDG